MCVARCSTIGDTIIGAITIGLPAPCRRGDSSAPGRSPGRVRTLRGARHTRGALRPRRPLKARAIRTDARLLHSAYPHRQMAARDAAANSDSAGSGASGGDGRPAPRLAEAARALMDGKAKPPGSLGMLEDWAVRCAHHPTPACQPTPRCAVPRHPAPRHAQQRSAGQTPANQRGISAGCARRSRARRTQHSHAAARRLCEVQGTLQPRVTSMCLLLFAADHGVTRERPQVSAYPREVTTICGRPRPRAGHAFQPAAPIRSWPSRGRGCKSQPRAATD